MRDFFCRQKMTKFSATFLLVTLLAGCSDNTGGSGTTTTPTTPTITTIAALQLSAAPTTVKSDNSSNTTVSVTAVDAANVVVSGATISFSTNTGSLTKGSVTTDSAGSATLTFSSGTASKANRVATITASAGAVSANIPVQIVGSTVVVTPSAATLPNNGTTLVTLNIAAKDAGGNAISNSAVTLTTGGAGAVTLAPSCTVAVPCMTDASGNLSVSATGTTAGAVTVTIAAVGTTTTSTLTVSPSTATFAIDQLTLNTTTVIVGNPKLTAMKIGDTLDVRVNAPAATSVVFVTSMGKWNGTPTSITIPVVAGKATASLTTTQAGSASVSVYDPVATTSSDSLNVTMTATTPAKITIQASPAVVKTKGVSTLTALVQDANNFPVGDVQVAFSILNPTGGGESVTPPFATTTSLATTTLASGEASTSFTAGSITSTGIQVRASVIGFPSVVTEAIGINATPSGNDASISINGTASSVTFGQAVVLQENANLSGYVLPMNVTVVDNSGAAVQGAIVNLSVWPIAWSTSSAPCMYDPDTPTTGTFYNEDANENFNLETTEDGTRTFYTPISAALINTSITVTPSKAGGFNGLAAGMKVSGAGIPSGTTISSLVLTQISPATNPPTFYVSGITLSAAATLTTTTSLTFSAIGGTVDSLFTPPNAAAGSVPSSVKTDVNGQALFNLNYTKTNGIWIVDRIRATTLVYGSQAVGETTFRLGVLEKDANPCKLPPSPYHF